MYESIWNQPLLSVSRMQAEIEQYFELSRWSSYDRLLALARQITERMEAAGMENVRLITAPADGRTCFGGWVMPGAFDVQEASLFAVIDGGPEEPLADYAANPTSLMLYSMPTPPGGVEADLVIADSLKDFTPGQVAGRIVLRPFRTARVVWRLAGSMLAITVRIVWIQ